MGHSYNYSLVTSGKGLAIEAFAVKIGASGAPTLVDNGMSGFVASVAKTATGRYTFTLNVPVPPAIVSIQAEMDCVAANGAIITARYVAGSYNATAGTFEIDTSTSAPAAGDPTSGTTIHVFVVFARFSTIATLTAL